MWLANAHTRLRIRADSSGISLPTYRIIACYSIYRRKINIAKTCLYNIDPLKPHFYIVKLGFTGVYIIFLISAQNIDCGYSLEPPRRGGSNEYPQSMFWAEIRKISEFFLSENFQFLEVKFSLYLNRHVFVMDPGKAVWCPGRSWPLSMCCKGQFHMTKLKQEYVGLPTGGFVLHFQYPHIKRCFSFSINL